MKARLELFLTASDPSTLYLSHAFNRLAAFANRDGAPEGLNESKNRLIKSEDHGCAFMPEDPGNVCRLLVHRARIAREHAMQFHAEDPTRIELLAAAGNAEECALQLADWWAEVGAPVARAQSAIARIQIAEPDHVHGA